MEPGEDFWLQYNDGSGWQIVATYASGQEFQNNQFYTSTVTLDASQFNLSTNGRFRFRCDASGNGDRVYIDAVTITGNTGRSRKPNGTRPVTKAPTSPQTVDPQVLSTDDEDGFTLYPNPAKNILNVKTLDAQVDNIKIFSAFGMLVREMSKLDNGSTIDVSNLKSGTYFIRFVSGEDIITRKFVKE
jgi:hypothetical protein